MYGVRRALVWIARCRHCRGFGIHSPWAFHFVRDVVNERLPYYCYEELARTAPCAGEDQLRLCRLYFRIANFIQPRKVVDYAAGTDVYRRYIVAGCKAASVTSVGSGMTAGDRERLSRMESIDMLRMTVAGGWREFLPSAMEKAHVGSMFIVEGIKESRSARRLWRDMVADEKCTLTFDLHCCGIIYFDSKRYKQRYIVNF